MREYKASTARGKRLVEMGRRCCYISLSDIYGRWSQAKEKAYIYCVEQYRRGVDSDDFGIGNANSFGFTASWLETRDGERCMRIETKDNSYLVWLHR